MSKTTPATKALEKLGVTFALHTYVYDSARTVSACRPPKRSASSRSGC